MPGALYVTVLLLVYYAITDGDAGAGAVEQQLPPLWLVALTLEQWSSSCRPFALPLAPGSPLPQVARADSPLYYASK